MITPFLLFLVLLQIGVNVYLVKKYQTQLNVLETEHAAERNKLLDRVMANNLAEYKGLTNTESIKRVPSGNYFVDHVEKTLGRKDE